MAETDAMPWGAAPTPGARVFLGLPAPAKLNLFLHVVGRRDDGYHEIQSAFVPIGLADVLDFRWRSDGRIERSGDLTGPAENDLAVRAARLLQELAGSLGRRPEGADIHVDKRIPVGAGLGGGSSDAATTLIALNRLWGLRLPREDLARLGVRLGADVPFFLGDGPAFVEGIGERCTALAPLSAWYVVAYPAVAVSTAAIFHDPKLTRNSKRTTILGFCAAASAGQLFGSNDLEPVARSRVAAVDEALRHLGELAPARMSGSGSAVFSAFAQAEAARDAAQRLRESVPAQWSVWAVPALPELPLAQW